MFTVRRMTPSDKPAMMEIASRIWEGNDYLPAVFDAWVADASGEFVAVLLEGRLVGCGKLTFFTPADAWLEGLRKDPLVNVKGCARAVFECFAAGLASRKGLASVRFSTYALNPGSVGANERLGFRRRTVLSLKAWAGTAEQLAVMPLRAEERQRERVQTVLDEGMVFDFLDRTGYFTATEGLVVEGWRALPFSRELFAARYVRPGLCRGIVAGGQLEGLAVRALDPLLSRLMVRLVCLDAADDAGAGALFDDTILAARSAATRAGAEKCEIEWMLPDRARLKAWSAVFGLQSWEQEDDFIVYELPIEALSAPGAPGTGGTT